MTLEQIISFTDTIIILIIVIILGIILFILTGYIIVKKEHIAIIEKNGQFVGIYKKGWHYFTPLIYRRVGMYKLGEIRQKIIIDRETYYLTYTIENYYKFHYEGKHDTLGILKSSLNDRFNDLSKSLDVKLKYIGANFIKLEKVKRRR